MEQNDGAVGGRPGHEGRIYLFDLEHGIEMEIKTKKGNTRTS